MPILTTIRQSPAYLYLKTYCLCSVVTLFQATPLSSLQLPRGRTELKSKKQPLVEPRLSQAPHQISNSASVDTGHQRIASKEAAEQLSRRARLRKVLGRWIQRAVDLGQVKKQLRIDDNDSKIYPEINWDANVRRSTSLHHEEQRFIELRKHRISSRGTNSLHDFLGLPKDENVDPVDVPLIALGGSGGGYRAMYGFTGFISASKKLGLWDCLTWTAGVSGSCWTIAAYYTIASQSSTRLIQHYLAMGKEFTHPLSLPALTNVAGRRKGVYFLIGPLVRKVQSGIIGLGVMDIYATLTTAYQLISRSDPGAGLSRTTFQFSKVWTRTGLDRGIAPIPIFTAVRKSSKAFPTVTKNAESIISKVEPSPRSLKQHQTQLSETPSHVKSQNNSITTELREDQINRNPTSFPQSSFQWFEISPLEAGSSDAGGYVPTWSWGRSFMSGRSFGQPPEQSLSLFLGQCTSAPAGPLTGYISALLASLPQGTIMSRVLMALNEFVRMKRWEKTWGNPIRAGHDPNPFYGHNSMPQPPDSSPNEMVRSDKKWEAEGMIRLMDGGVSNNLPNHILARPERGAEIILTFDASSDVHKGSAIERIQDFANDCKLELEDENSLFQPPNPLFQDSVDSSAVQIERKFLHHYARVFQGRRSNGQELYLIYCPLLPSARNPGYDPSTASFSTSYNLVWTPLQIQSLLATSEAIVSDYVIQTIKQVVEKVYVKKKAERLALQAGEVGQIRSQN